MSDTGEGTDPGPGAEAATWAGLRSGRPLRPAQVTALEELDRLFTGGARRAWVVLPPGLGKTLTGLEAGRRLGRPLVVFGPNTAIQQQWRSEWSRFTPAPTPAGTRRSLDRPVTVLTYQSLATFDPDAEVDEDGTRSGTGHLRRLRPQGAALVAALRDAGEVTLLLDECHHLLETWGELLAELLRELPRARVIGLTATPPDRLTARQAELVDELFGEVVRGPSIPASVREGSLAPYAELAWLTTPTAPESEWLAEEAERFTRLTVDLLRPDFASTPFLEWVDARVVRRRGAEPGSTDGAVGWHAFQRQHPELAAAGLRFHHHGLLALPEGARLLEEHRHAPTAEDWIRLLDDWIRHCLRPSSRAEDREALEAVGRALPAVGYQLTRRGIRQGRSPVDRLLARSAAKTHGVREILAAEDRALGERLRAVVICDHERAAATLPPGLVGVLDSEAGSARLVLAELVADPRTARLAPVLVTGSTVAADAETAEHFRAYCQRTRPGLELRVERPDWPGAERLRVVVGAWSSRRWVALVTAYLASGASRVLVGTRGMLGEGWDARGVNTLVDLTEATTATAVVQIRGRALRTDPDWAGKTAHNWSVVCVRADHPKGQADWQRFVRKHQGYLALTDSGAVMDGVAHVHPELSPYAPPDEAEFDRLNLAMLDRADHRDQVRERWRVGEPYEERLVHTVRVVVPRAASAPVAVRATPTPPSVLPTATGVTPAPSSRAAWLGWGAALPLVAVAVALGLPWPVWGAVLLAVGAVAEGTRARAGARRLAEAGDGPPLERVARAVADGLRRAGLTSAGAEAVTLEPDGTGAYQAQLRGVPYEESERFALALDEAVSPVGDPRYLLPRYVPAPPGLVNGWLLALGRPLPQTVVHHAVPTSLGVNRRRALAMAEGWRRYVSAGEPLGTRSAEGAGVLAAQVGLPPMEVTTAMRVAWH
ncbi:DEAD/DEAH box helicase family protein [Streptomyces sp. NPDC005438]|uniref:DEAD/DEAH box helicase family protein n=1 Tax=Streptomyces sp. NPDC005438 TaxID=3156880 RepID=UPI0033A47140